MIRRIISAVFTLFLISIPSLPAVGQGQVGSGRVKIFAVDPGNGQMKEIAQSRAQTSGKGRFRTKTAFEVDGQKASVRLSPTSKEIPITFNFELNSSITPEKISLVRLQPQLNRRLITLGGGRAFADASARQIPKIDYIFTQTSRDSYSVTVVQGLPPGEYAFNVENTFSVFDFAIDIP